MKKRIMSLILIICMLIFEGGFYITASANSIDWASVYTEYLLTTNFVENNKDTLSNKNVPTVALLDLDFDDIPELIYYDGGMKWGGGGINKNSDVYGIDNNSVSIKEQISLQNVEYCALCINNETNKKEYLKVSGASQIVEISPLSGDGEMIAISNRAGVAGITQYRWFNNDNIEIYSSEVFNWPEDIEKIANYTLIGLASSKEYDWKNSYSYGKKKEIIDEMISAYKSQNPTNESDVSDSNIKIILNGSELTFDQPPINEDGRLLVPIRQIAETMGDTVKWNGDIQTAFVQHRDRAIIIPLNIDYLYITYSDKPVEWNKYTLDVPSQEKNGRALTPIRAFCESLGATVDYRDDERTAYIYYDYDANYLPFNSNCISGINMSYAIMRGNNVSFQPYTDEIYNFLEGRSGFLDNLAMSWGSGIFDGFVQLFKGESAMKSAVKASLASLITEMTNGNVYDDDTAEKAIMSTDAIENCSDLIEMINNKDFQKLSDDAKKAKLTEWSETNPELEQFSNIGDIIKWTSFSLEEIQYIFTDYSKNMAYIELLEDELTRYGIEDELIFECISDMKEEYTTGWIGALQNLQDTIVDEGLGKIADTATYGIFSMVNFAKDLTNQLTGLSETADGLYAFYGLCRYSGAIDLAYARALNSVYSDNYNADSVINLFNIQKAVKIEAYKSMNQIANAVDEVSWDDRINSIKSMTYVLWK